ncbi:hypothetical protein Gohar_004181, partial [Gossypium harknessii]|nr:hypothetical protein [Gossypium harknessii]
MENMEKRLGEAEDPIRLDQQENTGSIQERIENEKFDEWMFVDHRNCRQNWRTDDGQEMKNQGGGIEKTGTSSVTLKIGPNVGSGLSKFGTNGNQGILDQKFHSIHNFKENQNLNDLVCSSPLMGNELGDGKNIDGLVGMVPVRQTIQGMVDRLEVEGRAAN